MNGEYGNGAAMNGAGINQGYNAGVNRPNANVPGSGLSAGNLSGLNTSGVDANSATGNTAGANGGNTSVTGSESGLGNNSGIPPARDGGSGTATGANGAAAGAVTVPPAAVARATLAQKQVPSRAVRKTMRPGALPRPPGVVLLRGNLSWTGRGGVSCVLGRSTTSATSSRPLSGSDTDRRRTSDLRHAYPPLAPSATSYAQVSEPGLSPKGQTTF